VSPSPLEVAQRTQCPCPTLERLAVVAPAGSCSTPEQGSRPPPCMAPRSPSALDAPTVTSARFPSRPPPTNAPPFPPPTPLLPGGKSVVVPLPPLRPSSSLSLRSTAPPAQQPPPPSPCVSATLANEIYAALNNHCHRESERTAAQKPNAKGGMTGSLRSSAARGVLILSWLLCDACALQFPVLIGCCIC
jgi:hypothetical protein